MLHGTTLLHLQLLPSVPSYLRPSVPRPSARAASPPSLAFRAISDWLSPKRVDERSETAMNFFVTAPMHLISAVGSGGGR